MSSTDGGGYRVILAEVWGADSDVAVGLGGRTGGCDEHVALGDGPEVWVGAESVFHSHLS